MPVDRERLTMLISEIDSALSVLKELAKEKESILKDPIKIGSAKYYLIVAMEACIDICNHIVAKERLGAPESYSRCFEILERSKIIDRDLASKMTSMAKFRNLLVHLYWKVDDERVCEILQKNLQDFVEFTYQIASKYLQY